jgi:hypothetical protein
MPHDIVGTQPPVNLALTTPVEQVGIVTRNRPALLARAVASYVATRPCLSFLICDDSDDPATQAENLAAVQAIVPPAQVRYVNTAVRQTTLTHLLSADIAPPDVLQFGLGHTPEFAHAPRTGVNRNWLLLATKGQTVLAVDDDTLAQPYQLPFVTPQPGVRVAWGQDPAQNFYFATDEDAVAASTAVSPLTFWQQHESVLGQTVKEVYTAVSADPATLAHLPPRFTQPDSRIVATVNGLVGDCGLGFPFGFTATAVGALLQASPSAHHTLTQSHEHYQMALTSRHLVRQADRLTLSDGSYLMTTALALDNRHPLPPFMPLFRAQDIIWGQTLWQTQPNALIAHLPLALRHLPTPSENRRFWPGEFIRSATGYDSTRLILDCLLAYAPTSSPSLAGMGQFLQQLGEAPLLSFAQFVQQEALRRNQQFLQSMAQALDEYEYQPAYWAQDVQRYAATMRQAMAADEYIVPVDLRVSLAPREALAQGQKLVRLLGQWFQVWEDVVGVVRSPAFTLL